MDPIAPITEDSNAAKRADEAEHVRVEAIERKADAAAAVRTVEAGTLAEVESLLGVVTTRSADAEVDALRESLHLDDAPQTAVPTNEQQAEISAMLRDRIARDALARLDDATSAAATDPTERYEVHDAALTGDAIARAIEAAAQDRDDARELAAEAADEDDLRAARALDRFAVERDGDRAEGAARAAMSMAADAADVVLASQADVRSADERSRLEDQAAARRQQEADLDARAQDDRADRALQARRDAERAARVDATATDRGIPAPTERTSQLAGSAAASQAGAGRPQPPIDDRVSEEDEEDRAGVEEVERIELRSQRLRDAGRDDPSR